MIRVNELKGRIVACGLTQAEVAHKIGITPKTLSAKLQRGVLDSDEIYKLMDILSIDDPVDIFFAEEVTQ